MTQPPTTDDLITQLSADMQPVKRLRPPQWRATIWLASMAACCGVAISLMQALHGLPSPDLHTFGAVRYGLENAGMLATTILAALSAFVLSVPGRSRLWLALPLPAVAVWLGAGGLGCWRSWQQGDAHGLNAGQSFECFTFIVIAGLPILGSLLWALRQARPIAPEPVVWMAGLSAAGLCATVLQFVHPHGVGALDLAFHLAAVAVLMGLGRLGVPILAVSPSKDLNVRRQF